MILITILKQIKNIILLYTNKPTVLRHFLLTPVLPVETAVLDSLSQMI